MASRERIDTSGRANPLAQNPFGSLDAAAFPAPAASSPAQSSSPARPTSTSIRRQPNRNRGRVDVMRQTAGRGGKTVTTLSGFKGIADRELQELAREIRRAAGVGGTVKNGTIEIQGDQRERACTVLEAAGFRPVLAGG